MAIITLGSVSFKIEDWLSDVLRSSMRKCNKSKKTSSLVNVIERAYLDGNNLLNMRASIHFYSKKDNAEDMLYIESTAGETVSVNVAEVAAYLSPARKIAIVLCTIGPSLEDKVQRHRTTDPLFAYYLEMFGEKALADIGAQARAYVESTASGHNWGVSPTLLPGSVSWNVTGQRDLFRLGYGIDIGLAINEASFLIPRMSKSFLIGMGEEYRENISKSMCHECPKFKFCSWRREDDRT